MNLSKVFWIAVFVVIIGGGYMLTTKGMEKAYQNATSTLPGNDPARDVADEATLTKYGEFQQTIFRYQNAKMFYKAAIDRYGESVANYWSNLHQFARCEQKLGNEMEALEIYYTLWDYDASSQDSRVPSSETLANRIKQLIALNDLDPADYPLD